MNGARSAMLRQMAAKDAVPGASPVACCAGAPCGCGAAAAPPAAPRSIDLLGVEFDVVTERECIEGILSALDAGRGGWVVTPNLDILRRCVADEGLRSLAARADLVVADGMPLIWASRIQRTPLPERVAGSSLVWTLSEAAGARGRSIFLLGGDPGVAERAAAALSARIPGVRIVGTHCPPHGFEKDEAQMRVMERLLAEARPDIVYVGLGFPKQERLIQRLRPASPGSWWLGVGISLSFLCGEVRRAPRWAQRLGLEWTHRLAQEPRRLAKRYLLHGLPFAARLLASAAWRGLRRAGRIEGDTR